MTIDINWVFKISQLAPSFSIEAFVDINSAEAFVIVFQTSIAITILHPLVLSPVLIKSLKGPETAVYTGKVGKHVMADSILYGISIEQP
eukprot:CAMPEP_0194300426 /NCGR_PEP_ID=MMETSP0169-20130528/61249_1 /TAXON_ID=218684 /ORGANISM="Corethron pennatum, Strain L29A3" /LENGTH=88 /DNA_ID=CAMNT_0039050593 /DNA_START=671 /DNA_END=937 /DNA_ORIENTATION=+